MANTQTSVPLFVANTVLTAAQQNLSAGTGVPVFATNVTRDAAFGGANKALAAGQMCFVESAPKRFQFYNGTAFLDYDLDRTAYTPTLTNVVIGNGTLSGHYYRMGKYVVGGIYLSFGSTTSVSGIIGIGLPFTVANNVNDRSISNLGYGDTGVTTYQGWGLIAENGTKINCYVVNTAATYANVGSGTSATVPFTWTTTDEIYGSFIFEAA